MKKTFVWFSILTQHLFHTYLLTYGRVPTRAIDERSFQSSRSLMASCSSSKFSNPVSFRMYHSKWFFVFHDFFFPTQVAREQGLRLFLRHPEENVFGRTDGRTDERTDTWMLTKRSATKSRWPIRKAWNSWNSLRTHYATRECSHGVMCLLVNSNIRSASNVFFSGDKLEMFLSINLNYVNKIIENVETKKLNIMKMITSSWKLTPL